MKYYLYREKADLSLHFHSLLYSPIHTHLVYTGVAINSHRNTTLFQPFDPPLKPLSKMAWSSPSPKNTLLSLSVFLYVSVSTQTLPLGTCVSTAGISEVETWLQSTTQVGGMQTHQVGAVPLSAAPVHMLPPQLHSAHHTPFSYSAGIGSPQFISRSPPTVHLKIYFNSKLIFLEQCSSWGRGF